MEYFTLLVMAFMHDYIFIEYTRSGLVNRAHPEYISGWDCVGCLVYTMTQHIPKRSYSVLSVNYRCQSRTSWLLCYSLCAPDDLTFKTILKHLYYSTIVFLCVDIVMVAYMSHDYTAQANMQFHDLEIFY